MSSSIASRRLDPKTAQNELTDHPRYKYRGCAPESDDPRMAAGNNLIPVTSWEPPDVDGGEEQPVRREREQAAVEVCVDCPVMVQCLAYGSSVNAAGKLAEPFAVLGGMTPLERHKAFVRERQEVPVAPEPAPERELRTEQKLAVLRALAAHEAPEDVAAAAGLGAGLEGLRTAKWQISRLKTQLGLPKSATRAEVLEAAVARGLLRAEEVAEPGPVETAPVAGCVSAGRRGGRGRRVAVVPGQLSFFDDGLEVAEPAPVTALFPPASVLGAAA